MVTVRVKFLGSLLSLARGSSFELKIDSDVPITVFSCIQALKQSFGEELVRNILDERSAEPRVKTLILKNGVEIRALEKLNTKIKDNDELTFIPYIHGG